jgi:hypothetical protein
MHCNHGGHVAPIMRHNPTCHACTASHRVLLVDLFCTLLADAQEGLGLRRIQHCQGSCHPCKCCLAPTHCAFPLLHDEPCACHDPSVPQRPDGWRSSRLSYIRRLRPSRGELCRWLRQVGALHLAGDGKRPDLRSSAASLTPEPTPRRSRSIDLCSFIVIATREDCVALTSAACGRPYADMRQREKAVALP